MGIDITAYDCWRSCQVWSDLKGEGVALSQDLNHFQHPDPAKFANSFEVLPLQADLRQHFSHFLQV